MPSHAPTHVDPRSPLVLDTRELGRRPGSMQRLRRTVPAPEALGIGVIEVPPGSEITLDLRLEAVMEGVLVSGPVHAEARGECARCLDPMTVPVDVELLELYAYPGRDAPEDDDIGHLVGDFIDLEARLRDAVVLGLPLRPVCFEDCPGLCATCGARLIDEPPGHTHEQLDPRWSTLQGLSASHDEGPSTTDEER
jgi:uncharacterized protein